MEVTHVSALLKRFTLGCLLCTLLGGQTTQEQPQLSDESENSDKPSAWISLEVYGEENTFIHDSVRVTGNVRRAWFKSVIPRVQEDPDAVENPFLRGIIGGELFLDVNYMLARDAYNCNEETTRREALTIYYNNGTVRSFPKDFPDEWEPVPPETIASLRMKLICAWKFE